MTAHKKAHIISNIDPPGIIGRRERKLNKMTDSNIYSLKKNAYGQEREIASKKYEGHTTTVNHGYNDSTHFANVLLFGCLRTSCSLTMYLPNLTVEL